REAGGAAHRERHAVDLAPEVDEAKGAQRCPELPLEDVDLEPHLVHILEEDASARARTRQDQPVLVERGREAAQAERRPGEDDEYRQGKWSDHGEEAEGRADAEADGCDEDRTDKGPVERHGQVDGAYAAEAPELRGRRNRRITVDGARLAIGADGAHAPT